MSATLFISHGLQFRRAAPTISFNRPPRTAGSTNHIPGRVMHQIAVPNGTIGVFAQGRGEPVLFVHGFPLGHEMWNSQTAAFAKNHRVIAPDLRGFGESKLTGATAATAL